MRIVAAVAALAAVNFGAAAHAAVITGAQLSASCAGVSSCSPATGVTVTSSPGAMAGGNVGGVAGIGIAGVNGNEIDAGELLTINFASAVTVDSFRLSAFFNGDEFGDENERAF
ncbi:MAG: hypothetical protein K2Q06_01180, partial [Parvularculaceae bacterium]|nr:hypothetical protein [Parvularculaceae bacterium]